MLVRWRHLVVLCIVHLASLDAYYVDSTKDVPAWNIESLTPELDKITFPDNTLDDHRPYVVAPVMVYPSPTWTWEPQQVESESVQRPITRSNHPPMQQLRHGSPASQNLRHHSLPNSDLKPNNNHLIEHQRLQKTLAGHHRLRRSNPIHRNSASSPVQSRQRSSLREDTAITKMRQNRKIPLGNFGDHHSFQDTYPSGIVEQSSFARFMLENQRRIKQEQLAYPLIQKKPILDETIHEGVDEKSPMSKHDTGKFQPQITNIREGARKSHLQRPAPEYMTQTHVQNKNIPGRQVGIKQDISQHRNNLKRTHYHHPDRSHGLLPGSYHDNLPKRIQKTHVSSGLPAGWDNNGEIFAAEDYAGGNSGVSYRDHENLFRRPGGGSLRLPHGSHSFVRDDSYFPQGHLSPHGGSSPAHVTSDSYNEHLDYDHTSSNKGQIEFDEDYPLAYHATQVFGETSDHHPQESGKETYSPVRVKSSNIGHFDSDTTYSPVGVKSSNIGHFDSDTLDLDYNVQYDFGIPETQRLKGDAEIVEPGFSFDVNHRESFSHFGGHGAGVSDGFSKPQTQSIGSDDTIIQSGYNFGSGQRVIQSGGLGSYHSTSAGNHGFEGDHVVTSGGHESDHPGDHVNQYGSPNFKDVRHSSNSGGHDFNSGKQNFNRGNHVRHLKGDAFNLEDVQSESYSFDGEEPYSQHNSGSNNKGHAHTVDSSDILYQSASLEDRGNKFHQPHNTKISDFVGPSNFGHAGSQDSSNFKPIGHEFGHEFSHSRKDFYDFSKSHSTVSKRSNFNDEVFYTPIKLDNGITVAQPLTYGSVDFSSGVQPEPRNPTMASLDDQAFYVRSSLGENHATNLYETQQNYRKKKPPSMFKKLETTSDGHLTQGKRNVVYIEGSESAEHEPGHHVVSDLEEHKIKFEDAGRNPTSHAEISNLPAKRATFTHEPTQPEPRTEGQKDDQEHVPYVEPTPRLLTDRPEEKEYRDVNLSVVTNSEPPAHHLDHEDITPKYEMSQENEQNIATINLDGKDQETDYEDVSHDQFSKGIVYITEDERELRGQYGHPGEAEDERHVDDEYDYQQPASGEKPENQENVDE
ncbi:uncharacterized protein LOC108679134 isoform X2 [Hyalella azteca]|uniref:Uncharacterized protein LOC108679134 isoform X2 n=1 Tax=Hyalella azteca TaxID=294128 RepID=A0A8B7PBZ7_HYAAZ|nr:uncharacterized protein LOC108679134 isoform X2 [Hyalella azteca]